MSDESTTGQKPAKAEKKPKPPAEDWTCPHCGEDIPGGWYHGCD